MKFLQHRVACGAENLLSACWEFAEIILLASADGSTIHGGCGPFGGTAATIHFIAPPQWFRSQRMVVLYVSKQRDLALLL